MAKFAGMAGSIRGKVGNLVFVKGENGVSYGKAYQPTVANPRTSSQLAQRAKVNVVGKISKAASAELIAALGGSKKTNRKVFNREMLKHAVVEVSEGMYKATVAPEVVKFSQGSEVLHATTSDVIVGANKITYNLTLRDTEYGGIYGERVVIGVIRPEDKEGVSYFLKDDVVFPDPQGETPAPIAKEVYFPQNIEAGTMVVMWRCPFVLSTAGMAIMTDNLYNDDNEIVANLLTSGTANFRGWGDSCVQCTEVFQQA